jgi:hypothetical protein
MEKEEDVRGWRQSRRHPQVKEKGRERHEGKKGPDDVKTQHRNWCGSRGNVDVWVGFRIFLLLECGTQKTNGARNFGGAKTTKAVVDGHRSLGWAGNGSPAI